MLKYIRDELVSMTDKGNYQTFTSSLIPGCNNIIGVRQPALKKYAKQPVIMKLSPNVTDITEMARAAEAGGADVVSLINTITGMKIDINRRTFALANKTGGMSGPAVKPVAVRMVYQVAQAVNIPIIGMGGISCAEDAIEFLLAGASAVSVGTANFHDPAVTLKVIDGIEAYMKKNGFETVKDMVGIVK